MALKRLHSFGDNILLAHGGRRFEPQWSTHNLLFRAKAIGEVN